MNSRIRTSPLRSKYTASSTISCTQHSVRRRSKSRYIIRTMFPMADVGENDALSPLPPPLFFFLERFTHYRSSVRPSVRLLARPPPISLVQRRGRTSATCSEAPEGAPRNKRARIRTSLPTSAPASDESSNVTVGGPRERGNDNSGPSDIEPSTTCEEDLALVSLPSISFHFIRHFLFSQEA